MKINKRNRRDKIDCANTGRDHHAQPLVPMFEIAIVYTYGTCRQQQQQQQKGDEMPKMKMNG